MTKEAIFPSWRYGPKGEAEVFQSEAEVPKGWKDAPFAEAPAAFDHDGDGKAGGSIAPEPTDTLKELRDEYRALVGKKPFAGWDEAELAKRIAEAKPAAPVEIDVTEF